MNDIYIYVKSFYPSQDNGFFPDDDWFSHKYNLDDFLDNFKISTYGLKHWDVFYETIQSRLPENILEYIYIICPTYWIKDNNDIPDFQIQVSGKVCNEETYEEAVSRELGEELGIVPKRLSFVQQTTDDLYMINYSYCENVKSKNNIRKRNEYEKVNCFVYINRKDIGTYLRTKIIRLYDRNEVNLRFACIIPLQLVNDMIVTLREIESREN